VKKPNIRKTLKWVKLEKKPCVTIFKHSFLSISRDEESFKLKKIFVSDPEHLQLDTPWALNHSPGHNLHQSTQV
jgi:hypothetical protein